MGHGHLWSNAINGLVGRGPLSEAKFQLASL